MDLPELFWVHRVELFCTLSLLENNTNKLLDIHTWKETLLDNIQVPKSSAQR